MVPVDSRLSVEIPRFDPRCSTRKTEMPNELADSWKKVGGSSLNNETSSKQNLAIGVLTPTTDSGDTKSSVRSMTATDGKRGRIVLFFRKSGAKAPFEGRLLVFRGQPDSNWVGAVWNKVHWTPTILFSFHCDRNSRVRKYFANLFLFTANNQKSFDIKKINLYNFFENPWCCLSHRKQFVPFSTISESITNRQFFRVSHIRASGVNA